MTGKKIRIAINGFGRIGRYVCRLAAHSSDIELVAINDISPLKNLAYLLAHDSAHGLFEKEVLVEGDTLYIDGHKVHFFSEKDPALITWKDLNIDYVIESTGRFRTYEAAASHLKGGAKNVLLSAPAKDDQVKTVVLGVNEEDVNAKEDKIISAASCTTNCLAPLVKILLDNFGIEEGLMTTIHAATASQAVIDIPSTRDYRLGRSALGNIIPATTGAALAVSKCLPALKGKLTGMAFRVPVMDVSVVDLTVRLKTPTNYEEISHLMSEYASGQMKGILGYTEKEVVSTDFLGSSYSSIYDKTAGMPLNDRFFKLVSWYDNEAGYSNRLIDLVRYMTKKGAAT